MNSNTCKTCIVNGTTHNGTWHKTKYGDWFFELDIPISESNYNDIDDVIYTFDLWIDEDDYDIIGWYSKTIGEYTPCDSTWKTHS